MAKEFNPYAVYGLSEQYDIYIAHHPVDYEAIDIEGVRTLNGELWYYYGTDVDRKGRFDVLYRVPPVTKNLHEGIAKEQDVVYIRSMFKEALQLASAFIEEMSEDKYGAVLSEHEEAAKWLSEWAENYMEKFN